MMRTRRILGVLPLGTMNLLAKDLGVPLQPEDAITALARGRPRQIDVAEVNGRLFLSHAVIGLYPRMVRERERQRAQLGIGKWPAMAWAALATLPRSPMLEARLLLEQGARDISAAALAVSNNPLAPGDRSLARPRLDAGRLGVYVAKHRNLPDRLRLMASLALGTWQEDDEMEAFTGRELDVVTRRGRPVTVALDGDLHRLSQPLRFRILPGALSVLWPASPAESADAGAAAAVP
jgi:diacylglycerol kinase family enzyme